MINPDKGFHNTGEIYDPDKFPVRISGVHSPGFLSSSTYSHTLSRKAKAQPCSL
jgi:hypothetical protein